MHLKWQLLQWHILRHIQTHTLCFFVMQYYLKLPKSYCNGNIISVMHSHNVTQYSYSKRSAVVIVVVVVLPKPLKGTYIYIQTARMNAVSYDQMPSGRLVRTLLKCE